MDALPRTLASRRKSPRRSVSAGHFYLLNKDASTLLLGGECAECGEEIGGRGCKHAGGGGLAEGDAGEGEALGETGEGHGALVAGGGFVDVVVNEGEEFSGGYGAVLV